MNKWFEQHVKVLKSGQMDQNGPGFQNFATALWIEFMKEKQKKKTDSSSSSRFRSNHVTRRTLRNAEANDREVYPVSVYDTQSRLYENFARTVRSRDDTFYYVSFRRVSLKYLSELIRHLYTSKLLHRFISSTYKLREILLLQV